MLFPAEGERDLGSAMADRPRTMGRGIAEPPSDAAEHVEQSVDVAGGWARKTAGSGRVSAVAHLSKRRRGMRRGDAIAADQTQTPGTGDPRPAVGRGQMIGRHLSGLSCSL